MLSLDRTLVEFQIQIWASQWYVLDISPSSLVVPPSGLYLCPVEAQYRWILVYCVVHICARFLQIPFTKPSGMRLMIALWFVTTFVLTCLVCKCCIKQQGVWSRCCCPKAVYLIFRISLGLYLRSVCVKMCSKEPFSSGFIRCWIRAHIYFHLSLAQQMGTRRTGSWRGSRFRYTSLNCLPSITNPICPGCNCLFV